MDEWSLVQAANRGRQTPVETTDLNSMQTSWTMTDSWNDGLRQAGSILGSISFRQRWCYSARGIIHCFIFRRRLDWSLTHARGNLRYNDSHVLIEYTRRTRPVETERQTNMGIGKMQNHLDLDDQWRLGSGCFTVG